MIADKIKDLCKDRNLSVRELERRAGLGDNSISKWNRSSPTLSSLAKVASVLEVSVPELIEQITVEDS